MPAARPLAWADAVAAALDVMRQAMTRPTPPSPRPAGAGRRGDADAARPAVSGCERPAADPLGLPPDLEPWELSDEFDDEPSPPPAGQPGGDQPGGQQQPGRLRHRVVEEGVDGQLVAVQPARPAVGDEVVQGQPAGGRPAQPADRDGVLGPGVRVVGRPGEQGRVDGQQGGGWKSPTSSGRAPTLVPVPAVLMRTTSRSGNRLPALARV